MVRTAAAIYGGAAFLGLVEDLLPGGTEFSIIPGLVALGFVGVLLALGSRMPMAVLLALGPAGVVLIGFAVGTTEGPGDAAVLYMWPAVWVAVFFPAAAIALLVGWIGIVHAVVLMSLPAGQGNLDRWLDVIVSVAIVAAVVHTLSERSRRLLIQLEAEARVDQLTGVLNRRGFEERLRVELDRARRDGTPVAVVAFDIDHFKHVNDERGHETGDRVLAHLGRVLRAHTRSADVVARTGGEEFVTLLSGADCPQAESYAERVRAAFCSPRDDDLPVVTVSAGVTRAASPGDAGFLLQQADAALYEAKRTGRDRTVVYGRDPAGARPVLS
jgi:diguanylate cyclase (GGDEF)-like protein